MKKLIPFICFLYVPMSCSSTCFSDDEYKKVREEIENMNKFYDYVPSLVDCTKKSTKSTLEALVCADHQLEDGMLLLSKASVYAYENAVHATQNFDDAKYRELLNRVFKHEKKRDVAIRKLCYMIKIDLSNYLGSNFSYTQNIYEVISSKSNKNGVIVNSWGVIPELYLGKSCDASDSIKRKGKWYKVGEQFIVELDEKNYKFNHDDNVFKLNCEIPK